MFMSLSKLIYRKIEEYKMNRDYRRQRRRANSPNRIAFYLQDSDKERKEFFD